MEVGIAGTDIRLNTVETEKELREKAVRILKEKYHENFEIVSIRVPAFSSGFARAVMAGETYPDLLFRAYIDCEGDGESDTYVTGRVGQKIAEGCREQLQKLRGTYTLFAVPVIADCTLEDAGLSVEDYMQRIPGQSFTLYFFYAPEEDQEPDTGVLASELQNMLLKMPFIHGVVKAYFTSEETLRRVQEYMESVPEPGFDLMEITENASVLERPYQDGAVQITEEDLMKVLCR